MTRLKRRICSALYARKIARLRDERARLISEVARRRKEHRRVAHKQAQLEALTCQLIGLEAL